MALVILFLVGVLFALGLGVSGMTQPSKVVNFLDITGNWDPSLALVMMGAVITYFIAQRLILQRKQPVFVEKFSLPTRLDIDAPLIYGAALFGIGWGMAGFCPGPALASLVTGHPDVWVFVLSMATGMYIYGALDTRFSHEPDGGAGALEQLPKGSK